MGEIRAAKYAYDDDFIEAFLANPKNKTEAMRQAGYEGHGISQMANKTFNRLRVRINEEFERRKSDYAMLGHKAIVDVVEDEDTSNSDKLKAGKMLMDYGGHNPGQVIDVNVKVDSMSDKQLDDRIAELEKQIGHHNGEVFDVEVEEVEDRFPDAVKKRVEKEWSPSGFNRPGDNEEIEVESYDLNNEDDLNAIGEDADE